MMKCKKVIVRNQQLYVCFLWIVYFTDKKKTSLADLLFRRSPDKRAILPKAKKGPQVQILQGARGFRYINYQNRPHDISENPMDSPKIRNAVFCAVILEEFVKELAAFSQEQAVLAQSEVWPWAKLIACFGSYIYCQTLCGNRICPFHAKHISNESNSASCIFYRNIIRRRTVKYILFLSFLLMKEM